MLAPAATTTSTSSRRSKERCTKSCEATPFISPELPLPALAYKDFNPSGKTPTPDIPVLKEAADEYAKLQYSIATVESSSGFAPSETLGDSVGFGGRCRNIRSVGNKSVVKLEYAIQLRLVSRKQTFVILVTVHQLSVLLRNCAATLSSHPLAVSPSALGGYSQ